MRPYLSLPGRTPEVALPVAWGALHTCHHPLFLARFDPIGEKAHEVQLGPTTYLFLQTDVFRVRVFARPDHVKGGRELMV